MLDPCGPPARWYESRLHSRDGAGSGIRPEHRVDPPELGISFRWRGRDPARMNRYRSHHMNNATDDRSPAEKLEWQAPKLTTLGDAASLTMTGAGGLADGGLGSS